MTDIKLLGIDLAKNWFQLHGVGEGGAVLLQKKLKREQFSTFIASLRPCRIAMEACSSSHYWARKFREYGHEVVLIAPQYVKPFVRRHKTDMRDAEAICVAVQQPQMTFVQVKSVWQQELQSIHRIRSRLIKARTALVNESRGVLSEYGITIPQGRRSFGKQLLHWMNEPEATLTERTQRLVRTLKVEYDSMNERIEELEKLLEQEFKRSEACQRIGKIEGVGTLSATAIVAAVGEKAHGFKNSKHFSSWLGLTPRQHSSGGKETLLGISKQGDVYLRTLLIHGARNVVRWTKAKDTPSNPRRGWIKEKLKTKHSNVVSVAYARKNARVIFKILSSNEEYRYAE